MDVTNKIHAKLKKILKKLKGLGIIQTFKLEINFCQVEGNLKKSLIEIDSVLKKCLRKIINKPKRAEIRNIISELVRKKNLSDLDIVNESVADNLLSKKSCFTKFADDNNAFTLKFYCGICEKIFTSKKNFVIHKKEHKKSEKYLCEKCGKIFNNIQKWKEHEEKYKKKILSAEDVKNTMLANGNQRLKEFPETLDDISEYLFESIAGEELNSSIREQNLKSIVPEKREKQFICQCGKVFQVFKSFRKHERLKHLLRNLKYDCNTCGKSFIEKGKLNRHMLSHKDRQYSCSLCEKRFSRSDTLKRHVSLFHYTMNVFSCSFCHKQFKLKYNRDIHEENIHKNVSNWIQCEHCLKEFRNKVGLKSHLKSHFKNKITCTACSKSFTTESYFKNHMKTKHITNNKS